MRRPIAIALLSAATALSVPSIAGAQVPISPAKVNPTGLTHRVTPGRDRSRPYRFLSAGRLVLPAALPLLCPLGVTDLSYCIKPPVALACFGRVTITFRRNGAVRATRFPLLTSRCTYSARVTFNTRSIRGRLRVSARFGGNFFLNAISGPTRTVRAG